MTEKEDLKNYINVIIENLLKDAIENKKITETKQDDFYYGKRLAYYEVLKTIKNQALIYDINIERLKRINLDAEIAQV